MRAISPGLNDWLRCNGQDAFFGWPTSPEIENLRERWFDTPDQFAQKRMAEAIQQRASIDVPYYPLGIFYQRTAYRANITGVLSGLPLFWNVRRA
jgi:peptide/nickel transport system substrate-binding protein